MRNDDQDSRRAEKSRAWPSCHAHYRCCGCAVQRHGALGQFRACRI